MKNQYYSVELGQYIGLPRPVMETEVTEEDMKATMEAERQKHLEQIVVDAPAAIGDTVNIDYAGFLGEEQFAGGTAQGYDLMLGSGSFIPGFEDQLVGASAGDDVDVNVTFPEQYHAPDLAGKAVVFHCKVHQVKQPKLPELNDEFAQKYYQVATLEELMEMARQSVAQQKAEYVQRQIQGALLTAVVGNSQIQLEDSYVEDRLSDLMAAFQQQLGAQGMTLELYCQYAGTTEAQLREQYRGQAVAAAQATAVMCAVAEAEGLTATGGAIDEEMQRMAVAYQMDMTKLSAQELADLKENVAQSLSATAALKFVIANSVEAKA